MRPFPKDPVDRVLWKQELVASVGAMARRIMTALPPGGVLAFTDSPRRRRIEFTDADGSKWAVIVHRMSDEVPLSREQREAWLRGDPIPKGGE